MLVQLQSRWVSNDGAIVKGCSVRFLHEIWPPVELAWFSYTIHWFLSIVRTCFWTFEIITFQQSGNQIGIQSQQTKEAAY